MVRAVRVAALGGTEPAPPPPSARAVTARGVAGGGGGAKQRSRRIRGAMMKAKTARMASGVMLLAAERVLPAGSESMRVLQLRKELKARRLSTEGERSELLRRLQDWAAGTVDPAPIISAEEATNVLEPAVDWRSDVLAAMRKAAERVEEEAAPNYKFKLGGWKRAIRALASSRHKNKQAVAAAAAERAGGDQAGGAPGGLAGPPPLLVRPPARR
jgi:hypothetical protein